MADDRPVASSNKETESTINNKRKHSDFLDTFTFTNGNHQFCECDECEIFVRNDKRNPNMIPPSVAEAINRHQQLRRTQQPLRRSQSRSLIKREGSITVYDYHLPLNVSEPLVEFGNSHRIIWVKHLSRHSRLYNLGTGIIGSSAEEESRQGLEWEEGNVYFTPSNGGKAVGWVHMVKEEPDTKPSNLSEDNPSSKEEQSSLRPDPVIVRVAKLSVKDFEQLASNCTHEESEAKDERKRSNPTWSSRLTHILVKLAKSSEGSAATTCPLPSEMRNEAVSVLKLL